MFPCPKSEISYFEQGGVRDKWTSSIPLFRVCPVTLPNTQAPPRSGLPLGKATSALGHVHSASPSLPDLLHIKDWHWLAPALLCATHTPRQNFLMTRVVCMFLLCSVQLNSNLRAWVASQLSWLLLWTQYRPWVVHQELVSHFPQ